MARAGPCAYSEGMETEILIVEDDADTSYFLTILLSEEGYRVRSVADVEQAEREIRRNPPDLVLLDAHLPRRSGLDLCETLRQAPRTARIAVVMLSALTGGAMPARALDAGADDFIAKPFHPAELMARLRSVMRGAAAPWTGALAAAL
jgi:two-component system, OmpR family, phosphate regulon response regulator PhoB